MRLDHEFSVAAPIEDVWDALLDPERVAPCMPGATLTGVDGDTFTATVKVKLGPIALTYKGSGEFVQKDADTRTLLIKASGKDTKGAGTASASVTVSLTEQGATHGAVSTDLKVTGRPAQFGRGLISEVGGKLLGEFSECLSTKLAPVELPPMGAAEPVAQQQAEAEPIDLMNMAGTPVLKRAATIIAVAAALLAVIAIVRASRR
ncbi:MAG: SRPBCC family protein [Pseudonocardiaceae bacterium]